MTDIEKKAELEIIKYLEILKANGYQVSRPQKGNYCLESAIDANSGKLKLQVYYGKKGLKTVLQGNRDSQIYSEVKKLLFNELPFEKEDFAEPSKYIGTDESGKGDFFGPLVIAGVFVDEKTKLKLDGIGVRDSKQIAHTSIKKLADSIKKIAGQDSFNVVVINPPRYNELYEKFGNLNRMLAWGHARVLENILTKKETAAAISDKFGDERLILDSLQEKGKNLELYQFPKAEKYTAVAAASILARDRFNDWFDMKKRELNIVLPKGASGKVTESAKLILEEYGSDKLDDLIKKHFKTYRLLNTKY